MGKRKNHGTSDLVRHPRYGAAPVSSGLAVPKEEILHGHWSYQRDTIYPESVLVADASKQNYATFPRKYYVDVLRYCRSCNRGFIFFAREQKHWFETLRFYTDADCVHCTDCRRENQTVRRRLRRYSDLIAKVTKTKRDFTALVDDAAYLLRRGVLRRLDRLGHLKNEASKRIPEYPGTKQLAELLKHTRDTASMGSNSSSSGREEA